MYYGFSRFAIELNEVLESERGYLPSTDTRFRPDQRYLEVRDLVASLNPLLVVVLFLLTFVGCC